MILIENLTYQIECLDKGTLRDEKMMNIINGIVLLHDAVLYILVYKSFTSSDVSVFM